MRLTNQIRERVLKAALEKSGVFEEEERIKKLYADFAEKCRLTVVTPDIVKKIDKANEILKGVNNELALVDVNRRGGLYVNCAGQRRAFGFDGSNDRLCYEDEFYRITPREVTLKHGNCLLKDLEKADKAREKNNEKRSNLDSALRATLWSVTTDTKLYEVWPESKSFMPIVEGAPTVNFPALPIKELNKMIGLP